MTKVYVETSSFGFYYDDRSPRERDAVRALLARVRRKEVEGFTSETTLEEIGKAHEELASRLVALIRDVGLPVVPVAPEARALAEVYLSSKIVPRSHAADALHVAVAVLNGADIIATNNLKHIANYRAIERFHTLNSERGLRLVEILLPEQVV